MEHGGPDGEITTMAPAPDNLTKSVGLWPNNIILKQIFAPQVPSRRESVIMKEREVTSAPFRHETTPPLPAHHRNVVSTNPSNGEHKAFSSIMDARCSM